MVRIPYMKIQSVRVGSIDPTSDIGTGGAIPAPPTPITYLTQWKIVGNSEVHTDQYLTSWKVSGNSIVDNNTILSCGDLGQDGKYHVKISNGVTIFDILLDAPLRKINNVADTIEFPSDTEGKALVTRNIAIAWWKNLTIVHEILSNNKVSDYERFYTISLKDVIGNTGDGIMSICLSANYEQHKTPIDLTYVKDRCMCVYNKNVYIRDIDCHSKEDFQAKNENNYFFYVLATPTTELVDVSSFPVSPTDTYTSANDTPYSAFEHTEHKEIWSCGEYSAVDGKYHILVRPLGGSIADIALTKPLRKVNNVADSIEFPSSVEGKALVTRNFALLSVTKFIADYMDSQTKVCGTTSSFINGVRYDSNQYGNVLCNKIENALPLNNARFYIGECFALYGTGVWIRNGKIEQTVESYQSYFDSLGAIEVVYQLATPTTELIDAPQIEEADSYTCEISQGGKAVSWSSFTTD